MVFFFQMHLCIIFHGKKRSVTAAFPLWYFCAMFSGLHFLFCFVFSISRDLWCRMMEGIWSVTINRHSAIIFCPIEGWKLTAGNLYATFFARTILHFANFLHLSWFQPISRITRQIIRFMNGKITVYSISFFPAVRRLGNTTKWTLQLLEESISKSILVFK